MMHDDDRQHIYYNITRGGVIIIIIINYYYYYLKIYIYETGGVKVIIMHYNFSGFLLCSFQKA
jgi:hypothetical protein